MKKVIESYEEFVDKQSKEKKQQLENQRIENEAANILWEIQDHIMYDMVDGPHKLIDGTKVKNSEIMMVLIKILVAKNVISFKDVTEVLRGGNDGEGTVR